ncbi:MAG: hypothetical protein WCI18_09340 [Pseudomonadota bacterium]
MTQRKTLTQLWLVSLYRGVVSNVWNYLTLALCSGVLMALFFYVFNDLLTKQLTGLPQLEALSLAFGWIGGSLAQFRLLYISGQPHELSRFGQFINGDPGEISNLNSSRTLLWRILGPGIVWAVISTLPYWNFYKVAALFFFNIALFIGTKGTTRLQSWLPRLSPKFLAPFSPILRWRLVRLFIYNESCRILLLMALGFQCLMVFRNSASLGFLWLLALLSGILTGVAHILVAAEDLKSSWLEKNAGLSHESFIKTQISLSMLLAILLFLPSLLLGVVSDLPLSQRLSLMLTGPAVSAMVPGIILQIDGRRPEISAVVLVLLGLFVGTAILAHPLSFLLTILVVSYGVSSQSDRYYKQ